MDGNIVLMTHFMPQGYISMGGGAQDELQPDQLNTNSLATHAIIRIPQAQLAITRVIFVAHTCIKSTYAREAT